MGFVESLKADLGMLSKSQGYATRLERVGTMISDLATLQTTRLSSQPPQTLSDVQPPSQIEAQLAGKVATELQSQITHFGVKPGDLSTDSAIHQAIGIEDEDYDVLREFIIGL